MGRFVGSTGNAVGAVWSSAVAADPARPLLTYYDDASGERTELSAATLDNWVAKTANLLVDGCGLAAGDRATVVLPPHWQSAAVLLGCWSVGLSVGYAPEPAEVVFTTVDAAAGVPPAGDRFVLGLAPMGRPLRSVPPGFADYVTEVRSHGDHFAGPAAPVDQADLIVAARDRATALGITPTDRVLVDADRHPDPLDWLLAPLVAGATIVLCGHLDSGALPRRIEVERVTVSVR
jgi:uncharacterized protein (TIGR03089 family)